MAKAMTIQQKRTTLRTTIDQTLVSSATILANMRLHPAEFGQALFEALLVNPDIAECEGSSLARAIRECCEFGMIPNGRKAAIVKFGNEAAFIPMVKGLKEIAVRELDVTIRSGAIYRTDPVEIVEDPDNPSIKMRSEGTAIFESRTPEDLVGAFCWITKEGMTPLLVTITKSQIARVKARSRSSAWKDWPERMAEKMAVKRGIMELEPYVVAQRIPSRLFDVLSRDRSDGGFEAEGDDGLKDMGQIEEVQLPVQATPKASRKQQPKAQKADPESAPPAVDDVTPPEPPEQSGLPELDSASAAPEPTADPVMDGFLPQDPATSPAPAPAAVPASSDATEL